MVFTETHIRSLHYGARQDVGPGLALCEHVYKRAVQIRLWLYRQRVLSSVRLPVPVISVGNLSTGGTGKTPVVIAIARFLEDKGLRVAVLSRGYGAKQATPFHEAGSPIYGDEPYLIQQQLRHGKVFVGKNRVFTGQKAIETFNPDVILLDDGFQHLRLQRDLNILLVDGERGFGNERLLPAGPLREPLYELNRADILLLTKQLSPAIESRVHAIVTSLPLPRTIPIASCPFETLGLWSPAVDTTEPLSNNQTKPWILLSGIAQPQSFEQMARQTLQAEIVGHHVFGDHHRYTTQDLAPMIHQLAQHPTMGLLTTAKDWVKLADVLPHPLHNRVAVLQIVPAFDWGSLLAPILNNVTAAHA